jgi:S-adenosyl-L-methionine hydrolase (adenosine-forming)
VPRGGRRRPPIRLVTLSSDLGAAYAAQMKAVLLRSLSPAEVVDLTHDLTAHGVAEAAFVVRAIAARFPAGTVHVVVVDPGVGGARAPVAVRCRDGSLLVGPDNGVLVPLAEALGGGSAYRIDADRLGAPPRVGTTFDGRDVFAPAAVRLAQGVDPGRLGPAVALTPSPLRAAVRRRAGATGTVVHVDRFGNLVTDVPTDWLPRGSRTVLVHVRDFRRRLSRVTSYEGAGRGRLALLGSSFGTVEIAVGEGRADRRLGASAGEPVRLEWGPAAAAVRRNGK